MKQRTERRITMRQRLRIFILLLIAIASSTSSAALQAFPIVNLAFGKTASQSSTDINPSNGKPMGPNLAVDDNTNGTIFSGNVAQTVPNVANPWWQVDLGGMAYIDTIKIYLPPDRIQEFKSIYVFVSDADFLQVCGTASTPFDCKLPHSQLTNIDINSPDTFTINLQRTGQYVRIWMQTGSQLSLAEVQIPGIPLSTNPGIVGQWITMPSLHNTADTLDVGDTWDTLSLVHLSLLPSKRLLFWGRDKILDNDPTHDAFVDDIDGKSDAYLWDWSSSDPNSWLKLIPNSTANLFCAGHSFLRDGNLFVAGGAENVIDNTGTKRYDGDGNGEQQTHIFDWKNEKWIAGPVMRQPRWYPSLVTLSNGETLIIGGDFVTFDENNNRVMPFPHNKDTEILDRDGQLRRVKVVDPNNPGNLVPSELPLDLPNYPFAHLGPDGRALVVSGTSKDGLFYDPSREGLVCDLSTGLHCPWLRQPNLDLTEYHDVGTSVMFDKGKVMAIGGRDGTSNTTRSTETIDLNQTSPQWAPATPMHFERYYATSVLMPDGEIFVVGGSKCGGVNNIQSQDGTCRNGAVMYPEIYNSVPQTWSIMARQNTIRMYHSVAVLLPDATILVAGGGRPGAYGEEHTIQPNGDVDERGSKYLAHHQVEKFSPPYLFNADGTSATRPVITTDTPDIPLILNYGQRFNLGIGAVAATQIQQVVLIRLPSVTHSLNFDQRRVVLAYQVLDQQTLSVTAPANGIEAPPGPYMLFVLGPNGVPSTAEMISSLDYPPCSSPPPPTGLVATAASNGQVNITWAAPNVAVHHYELDRKQSVSAAFIKIADINNPVTNYTDQSVTSSVAYLYRVRAVCPSGSSSQPSNMDLATTISFTNDPLTAGVTIKAQYIDELRIAVNAVRATAGLAQAGWTDPSVQGVSVKAVHITELRQNLNQALQALGFTLPAYTDSTLSSGVTVKKAHVQDVRQALK